MKSNLSKKIKPKKSLGQNFLTSQSTCQKIIQACQLDEKDRVLEIGPGQGAITNLIAPKVNELYLIEKDKDLAKLLKEQFQNTNTLVFCEDFLKFDLASLPKGIKAVGNLPYNVATPIIEKIILNRNHFEGFYFMVQLEHGRRLTAKPDTKDYGSLTCFVQFYTDVKILFKIKPSAFYPPPKVQSCFMSMTFPKTPKYKVKSEEKLFQIIRQGFSQRRKMIQNTLKDILGENREETLKKLKINPKHRAENLTIEDFIKIAESV